ncbi:MAG: efflux RND transporter periplasmic adaptor subunit [Calditrichaeota bacterium]|nr:efflux RND transporter periplasmic adaptor subunit [Calditrichota bacterium]
MISKPNLLLLAAALFLACSGQPENGGESGAGTPASTVKTGYKIPVQVVMPTRGNLQEAITIYGKLTPVRETLLASQFAGRIVRLPFSEGDVVSAGQVVATLKSPKAEALSQVTSSAKAKEMLPITVRAPFSGVIVRKFHFAGDVVSPGEALVKLQDTSRFFLWGDLPAIYLNRVRPGQLLQVSFPDVPGWHVQTKIEAVNAAVNPETQMAQIRATVKNKNQRFKQNLLATIRIVTQSVQQALLLPRKAVLHGAHGDFVFLKKGGRARQQPVEIGLETPDTLEIRSGLTPADSVVLTGNYELQDGMAIREEEK